ncbi:MAG: hypothetical protein ACE5KG_05480 [Nitrososphaerales archaeon]
MVGLPKTIPSILAIISGILMISVSWTGGLGLLTGIFSFIQTYLAQNFSSQYASLLITSLSIIETILSLLAGLGGISVIIGGLILLWIKWLGKFLITMGSGVTILTMLFLLGQTLSQGATATTDLIQLMLNSTGWIAVILSLVARSLAK